MVNNLKVVVAVVGHTETSFELALPTEFPGSLLILPQWQLHADV